MRLGCILALLDEVPVPWSTSVTKLIDDVAGLNHPLAAKINEKRKQVAVNMLAKKYNIKSAIKNIDVSILSKDITLQKFRSEKLVLLRPIRIPRKTAL